jgi:hypothetical protein
MAPTEESPSATVQSVERVPFTPNSRDRRDSAPIEQILRPARKHGRTVKGTRAHSHTDACRIDEDFAHRRRVSPAAEQRTLHQIAHRVM